jgi:hypothetical protein
VTSLSYQVEVDSRSLNEALLYFQFLGGATDDAVRVAINKAGPKVRTKASQAIRGQVRLKAKYVNDRLKFQKASRSKLTGRITTPSRGLLLSRYSTSAQVANDGDKFKFFKPPPVPPRGIRVKVNPSGGTKSLPRDYFYMILTNSRAVGIVRRRPNGQTGPRGGRYKVAYGKSLSQTFNTVRDDVLPEASQIYEAQMLDAIRYLLQKRYPKE